MGLAVDATEPGGRPAVGLAQDRGVAARGVLGGVAVGRLEGAAGIAGPAGLSTLTDGCFSNFYVRSALAVVAIAATIADTNSVRKYMVWEVKNGESGPSCQGLSLWACVTC